MEQVGIRQKTKAVSWDKVKLGDIITISKGKKHKSLLDGCNRYINIENLHNPEDSLFTNENGTFVHKNDLIIAWDGANAGKVGVGFEGVIGSTLARLRILNENINSKFLFWFLESKNETIKSQRTGATIPHVSGSALKEIQIPLPPLPVQKRIAEILDAADALRRKDQELLKKYDELAQAIFIDMFGDLEFHTGPKVCLSEISEIINGVTKNEKLNHSSMISTPYLRVANVQDGFLDLSEIKEIQVTESDFARYQLYRLDILLTEGGDPDKLGRGSIWHGEIPNCIFQNHLFRVRIHSSRIRPEFLMSLIGSKYGKKYFLKAAKQTTGIASINSTQLKAFPVIIPPIEKQIVFENILAQLTEIQIIGKAGFEKSGLVFNSLLQKAFTGELVA